jgi:hypothetical protein
MSESPSDRYSRRYIAGGRAGSGDRPKAQFDSGDLAQNKSWKFVAR